MSPDTVSPSPLGQVAEKDLRYLRIYKTVVEAGGFAAAEGLLGTSRSTISVQIRALEERLGGGKLCQRGRKGFELTAFGEVVYQSTLELFDHLEHFRKQVGKGLSVLRGQLHIGVVDNTIDDPVCPLQPALRDLARNMPEVIPSLQVDNCAALERELKNGALDVAIVPMSKKTSGFNYTPLYSVEQKIYCGVGHPLFSGLPCSLTVEQVLSYPFAATPCLSQLEMMLPASAIKVGAHALNMEAIATLILTGRFLGCLPAAMAKRFVQEERLKPLGSGRFTNYVQFTALTRTEKPTVELKAFLKTLQSFVAIGDYAA
ncbi:LysR family transcriptional regulator [Endozoicomonadaceae bacterium StTr2]